MSAFSDALDAVFSRAGSATSSLGIGADYYSRLAQVESSNDPNAKSKFSSAGGLFQFIDKTWSSYGKGSRFGTGENVSSAVAQLTKDNYGYLTGALGRKPSYGELYLAHQQGAGGAAKLLSNPNARAADVVGYDAVVNNGGTYEMTAGEFASLWTSKFSGGPVSGADNEHYGYNPAHAERGASGWLETWLTRLSLIILGFVFVAIGLAMFKPAMQIIKEVPNQVAGK